MSVYNLDTETRANARIQLVRSLVKDDDNISHISYGIEIIERVNSIEYRRLIVDISTDKDRVEAFVDELIAGNVDPVHIDYLIEDFISS